MTPTTPEAIILDVLLTRLHTLSPILPIAEPNVKFDTPDDGRYLRVTHLPNMTQRMFIDSDGPSHFQGILQVSVFWPVDLGELDPREWAGRIADLFSADTKMVSGSVVVRSTKRPNVTPSRVDGSDYITHVSIEYESYI